MRILLVQDTDWINRNPIQHNHLMERMVLKGHQVHVIDYEILWNEKKENQLFSKQKEEIISRLHDKAKHTVIRPSIIRIPFIDYLSMFYFYHKEIKQQIKNYKPDLIIGDGIITPFLAFNLARKNKIKTMYYCIDLDYKLIPYKFLQSIGKIIESYNIRKADLTLSINEGLRLYTIKMGAKPEKTKVVRAGIDKKKFDTRISGKEIRDKYGIKKTDNLLFFVGWIYHFSGLKEVAIELSKLKRDDIKLLIVGDGDAYTDLEHLISNYNLENIIIMAGKQPYELLPKYLSAADICLLPAYNNEIMRDIVPIKMYEYMAMANPIIATRLPGIFMEFKEDNGIIYVDNPNDTLKAAIDLIEGTKLKSTGKKAKEFVEKYSWENISNDFENRCKELINDSLKKY